MKWIQCQDDFGAMSCECENGTQFSICIDIEWVINQNHIRQSRHNRFAIADHHERANFGFGCCFDFIIYACNVCRLWIKRTMGMHAIQCCQSVIPNKWIHAHTELFNSKQHAINWRDQQERLRLSSNGRAKKKYIPILMKSFYAWPGALTAWNGLYTHTIPQFHTTDEKSSSFLFINRIKLTTITRPNELNECVIK